MNLYGSICISDIPTEQIRKASNGKLYVNLYINEKKEQDMYGNTHYASCAPKKEERVEGKKYFCGDFKVSKPYSAPPTPEQVAAMPPAEPDDLPF